jgi:hypothetical protein
MFRPILGHLQVVSYGPKHVVVEYMYTLCINCVVFWLLIIHCHLFIEHNGDVTLKRMLWQFKSCRSGQGFVPWSKLGCRHRSRPPNGPEQSVTLTRQLQWISLRTNQIQAAADTSQVGISVVATLLWRQERLRNRRLEVHPKNEIKPEFNVFSCYIAICCKLSMEPEIILECLDSFHQQMHPFIKHINI